MFYLNFPKVNRNNLIPLILSYLYPSDMYFTKESQIAKR